MKTEVNPQSTSRAEAFSLWMSSPMPMVTITKTFDVSNVLTVSKRKGIRFNALLCWCIGKAASKVREFYILPEHDTLFKYDALAINVIVSNRNGGINSCDIPYTDDLVQFVRKYITSTHKAFSECESIFSEGYMVIGTSAMTQTELDSVVNQYTDKFCNPMLMWGRYRRHWFKVTLPISFQFHHVQMDGGHAALFLETLQHEINRL